MNRQKLVGPFTQLLTFDKMPIKGPLKDSQLEIIYDAGILVDGDFIIGIDSHNSLLAKAESDGFQIDEVYEKMIALPGFIDPHTHICWAGNRIKDYTARLDGKSYVEIAGMGGGIWDTVRATRKSFLNHLVKSTVERADRMLTDGVTTIEVKSGYGLSVEEEIKILQAIRLADRRTPADLISTCLAAHTLPNDFSGTRKAYLKHIINELLPVVYEKGLANRVDIYIDSKAFSTDEGLEYLNKAGEMGFELTVHADQFFVGGSSVAVKTNAVSADHLEVSGEAEIKMLAASEVMPVVLPGSSLGLGLPFAPARKILDAGAGLAIGSDWNPGSAPMGDLLLQSSLLGVYEKMTAAETLAAITCRAAAALNLADRGILRPGSLADIIAFKFDDYHEIVYNQGRIKPVNVWKKGNRIM